MAVVVVDQSGEYWVGVNLPIITADMGHTMKRIMWDATPRIDPMGPIMDKHLALLTAQAIFCKDHAAVAEFAAHTKKLMRRAVNTLWDRYNRTYATALDITRKMNIPQWATKPEGEHHEEPNESDSNAQTDSV